MPVFEASSGNSQGELVERGNLDLDMAMEVGWQGLQAARQRPRGLWSVVSRPSSGTQHESGGYNFSRDLERHG